MVRGLLVALLMAGPAFSPMTADSETDAVRESLRSSPWFEYEQDNYHEYTPDEIDVPEKRQRDTSMGAPPSASGAGALVTQLFYALLVGSIALLIVYLIVLIVRQRAESRELAIEEAENPSIEHSELPAELGLDTSAPLNRQRLIELIEAALRAGDMRRACIYCFLYGLLHLQTTTGLEIRKDMTAREYLRQLQSDAGEANTSFQNLFARLVREFEYALYGDGGRDPIGIPEIWKELSALTNTGGPR
ncbi:MAG: DUF4129 domain-containing protein [Spirochaetales bacterium]|nr:DUF4129 domain-containing protein [Spirochaetales bacterium]